MADIGEIKLILESMREENKANYSSIRATMNAEGDRLESKIIQLQDNQNEMKAYQKWQNGKLAKHEEAVKEIPLCKKRLEEVEDQTTFWRWAQRNKKFSIPAALLLLTALIAGIVWITPERVVEEVTGIDIVEQQNQ